LISRRISAWPASRGFARSIGVVPVGSSSGNTPSESMSVRVATSKPESSACSRRMDSVVAIGAPNRVRRVRPVGRRSIALATPKSMKAR
jgi:hypothetical protein